MSKNASPRATNAAISATARRGKGGLGIVGVASGVFAGGVCAAPVAGPAGGATGGRAEIVATASDVGVGAARCDEGLSIAKRVNLVSGKAGAGWRPRTRKRFGRRNDRNRLRHRGSSGGRAGSSGIIVASCGNDPGAALATPSATGRTAPRVRDPPVGKVVGTSPAAVAEPAIFSPAWCVRNAVITPKQAMANTMPTGNFTVALMRRQIKADG